MHEAERYLRNPENPSSLYVRIAGKRRRLFINRDVDQIGIVAPRRKRHGYVFGNWESIEKVYYPVEKDSPMLETQQRRMVDKYRKMAAQASFSSPYLRKVLAADPNKGLYENRLTSGTAIDGKVISLRTVERWCGHFEMQRFRQAVRECRSYHSLRFKFQGYEGSLWVEPCKDTDDGYREGDLRAGFSKEYKGCLNGYYYLLIDDDHFIGYDVD